MRRRDDPAPPDLFPTASSLLNDLDLDFDKWRAMLEAACRNRSKMTWLIGDLLVYAEDRYGNMRDAYDKAVNATGLTRESLMNIKAIAKKFETSRRREVLSLSHHGEVAGLSVEVQDALLDEAVKNHWTRAELRDAVAQRNVKKVAAQVTKSESLIPPFVHVTHEDHGVVTRDFINSLVHIDKPDPVKTLEEAQPNPETEIWEKAASAMQKKARAARDGDETKVQPVSPVVERDLADLCEVWGRACEEAREQFLASKASDFAELKKKMKKKLH